MRTTEEIIPAEAVLRVHERANFGNMSPREVINEGVFKYMLGWVGGYTQASILRGHGLITKEDKRNKSRLTRKGLEYARAMHTEGKLVFKG